MVFEYIYIYNFYLGCFMFVHLRIPPLASFPRAGGGSVFVSSRKNATTSRSWRCLFAFSASICRQVHKQHNLCNAEPEGRVGTRGAGVALLGPLRRTKVKTKSHPGKKSFKISFSRLFSLSLVIARRWQTVQPIDIVSTRPLI